jgi:HEAT repeat protein
MALKMHRGKPVMFLASAKLVNKEIVRILINLISCQDNHPEKGAAVSALGRIGDKEAVPALMNYLKNGGFDAVPSLVMLNAKEEAVPVLIEMAESGYYDIRSNAVRALGDLEGEKATQTIIRALRDESTYVQFSAVRTLEMMDGDRPLEALIRAVQGNNIDAEVRRYITWALTKKDDKRLIEVLIKALIDSEGYVRLDAAASLGRIGDTKAVQPLVELLKDKEEIIRWKATEALKKLTNQDFGTDHAAWKAWYEKSKDK